MKTTLTLTIALLALTACQTTLRTDCTDYVNTPDATCDNPGRADPGLVDQGRPSPEPETF